MTVAPPENLKGADEGDVICSPKVTRWNSPGNGAARRRLASNARIRPSLPGILMRKLFLIVLVLSYNSGLAYYSEYLMGRRRVPNRNTASIKLRKSTIGTKMTGSDSSDDFMDTDDDESVNKNDSDDRLSKLEGKMMKRVTSLEALVAKQEVEIHRLKRTCDQLSEISETFARVIQLLREAGLEADSYLPESGPKKLASVQPSDEKQKTIDSSSGTIIESFEESAIFGAAPSSVIDAADAAGAAILAAMLGGKQRMLVDVRDAELSRDPETLVQFIELALLPVAAGLEGLQATQNRVKIVFSKVSQLLEYRRTMALAAPEVVALSTLGFDPVEKRDKVVVIVAPEPDDEEGLAAMKELLFPSDDNKIVQQPVVILNYHMVSVAALPVDFETAYQLRLLSVQFMSGGDANEYFQQLRKGTEEGKTGSAKSSDKNTEPLSEGNQEDGDNELEDEALEAAMKHASEVGMNQGITRAMVIRAYPR